MSEGNIEERVRRLEDIEDIRTLRFRYHQYINEGWHDKIADLFTKDAVGQMDTLARWEGREAIRAFFVTAPASVSLVKQFPHNHIVEINGDMAKGISYFEARYAANGTSLMIAGSYDEEYVRTAGRWLIKTSIMKIHFAVPLDVGWGGAKLNYMVPDQAD